MRRACPKLQLRLEIVSFRLARIMQHFQHGIPTLMNMKFVHISAFLISAYLNMYALLIYAIFILGSLT